jgi:hypothetical protein
MMTGPNAPWHCESYMNPPRPHNARGQGRKPIPEEERKVLGSIRLTPKHWKLFRALGGAKHLSKYLDNVEQKAIEQAPD